MGTIVATIRIMKPGSNGDGQTVEALVDTGATLTKIPSPILRKLGIHPESRKRFKLANGRFVERSVGTARIKIEGMGVPALVAFGEPGEDALIGVTLLETAGLAADPVKRRLVPVEYLMM